MRQARLGNIIHLGVILVPRLFSGCATLLSAVSRLRPVVLAAATTVLGVIPLLQDVFWVGMAITIMAELTFGTMLTMIVVPVFIVFFIRSAIRKRYRLARSCVTLGHVTE